MTLRDAPEESRVVSDAGFVARVVRLPRHFWADNEVLDVFGPQLGPHALAVYMVLCRHAGNRTGKVCISARSIARQAGMSHQGALDATHLLKRVGLLRETESGNRRRAATYQLADVKALLDPPHARMNMAGRIGNSVPPDTSCAAAGNPADTSVNSIDTRGHNVDILSTGWTRNKEDKTSSILKASKQDHHACGALRAWLEIKAEIEQSISKDDYNLWLRPMYLLKEMSGRILLLALPPNGRIVEAARASADSLQRSILARGFQGYVFTKYPDDREREAIRTRYPDFCEGLLGNGLKSRCPPNVDDRLMAHPSTGSPLKDHWFSAGAGVQSGVGFVYNIWMKDGAAVEVSMDTEDKEENKRIFDELYQKREEVEKAFGAPLQWERLDDKKSSRVRLEIQAGGLTEESKWQTVQDAMIEAMDKLAKGRQALSRTQLGRNRSLFVLLDPLKPFVYELEFFFESSDLGGHGVD